MTKKMNLQETICLVDHEKHNFEDGVSLRDLDSQLRQLIQHDFPKATGNDFICSTHLVHYRLLEMDQIFDKDQVQSRKLGERMTRLMQRDDYQIVDIHQQLEASLTVGQKVADAVARFGGSWPFIISFISIMIVWIIINVCHLFGFNFDPYPFILLNLFLSMIAAIQAPLIMMSQNRAAEYDRLQARNDFKVNSKSEEEIRVLHAKVDHLIQQDSINLLSIQKSQTQMLGEIQRQLNALKHKPLR
ncbi:DUF1003 domain-containing protein [Agrilactobacillus yilanensis]|uniref:DUF1003 domain-containing protein n=1 Tax=Agrilactobacillus yilanensis TaxID=2485997 RepID=A0ABW4J593_9LACO|nr:DUF1003 domain-containing protein [Agrilactobacillus yilanensis]